MRFAWLGAIAAVLAVSSTASAGHNHCSEVSEIVGRRQCSRFGDKWASTDAPALWLEAGFVVRNFNATPIDEQSEVKVGGATHGYRIVGDPSTRNTTALALSLRATNRLGFLYFGGELDVGGILTGSEARVLHDPDTTSKMATFERISTEYFAVRAVVGVRLDLWRMSFASEIAPGVQAISYIGKARVGDNSADANVAQWAAVLEARSRIDVWVAPRLSFGIALGRSLRGDDGYSVGVFVSGHQRPYDLRR